jgi:hypothetical protein
MIVEVGEERHDAVSPEFRHLVGTANQAVKTCPATQKSRGAQRDVAASDQQHPDHDFLHGSRATNDAA